MNNLPILSTIVTFIFALAVFRRYLRTGGKHSLLWTIGLILYGLGTLSEVILSIQFNPWVLKLWYLTGAMLTAAWLGQGSVQLLVKNKKAVATLTIALSLASILSVFYILTASVTPNSAESFNVARTISEQYKPILGRSGMVIFLTILLNIYGTVCLVGGALYSSFIFWRKKVLFWRMVGNIFIAAGAMLPAIAGTFIKFGIVDALYISELIGVILMFIGFVLSVKDKSSVSFG